MADNGVGRDIERRVRAQFQILHGQLSEKRGVEMTLKSSAYVATFHANI